MSNKKATKRALLTSVMALAMCVVMLVGTTFAWFTDTAKTSVNKIQAGNLKMEVIYKNSTTDGFKQVNEKTNVFIEGALWEPGHVEYAVLNVKNVGNLALKYKLGINIANETGSTNVLGNEFMLSDYIKFAVIDGEANVADRDALVAAAENAGSKLINAGYSKESHLNTTDANETVTLVVWMPTDVGNEANHATTAAAPEIKLGIEVLATQNTYESDSKDNTYDEDATYPASAAAIKAQYGVDGLSMPGGVDIAVDTNYSTEQGHGHYIVTLNDEEAFVYFTQVFDRATACDARTEALESKTVERLPGESVHNNLNMWYGPNVQNITVKMGCDVDLNGMEVKPFGMNVTFDGQGHAIKNAKLTGVSGFFAYHTAVSNVTLDNIHVTATGLEYAGVVEGFSNKNITNVTVKNSSVIGGKYTGAIVGDSYADVTDCKVENTVVSGQYKVGGIVGYVCNETSGVDQSITGNTLTNVTVKGENLVSGKSDFVIGKIVGNWNKQNNGSAVCKDNTFSGTTEATANIGLKLGEVTEN